MQFKQLIQDQIKKEISEGISRRIFEEIHGGISRAFPKENFQNKYLNFLSNTQSNCLDTFLK